MALLGGIDRLGTMDADGNTDVMLTEGLGEVDLLGKILGERMTPAKG